MSQFGSDWKTSASAIAWFVRGLQEVSGFHATAMRCLCAPVRDEDVERMSPFVHERHINLLGRYSFAVPDAVTRGELRPLRNPNDADA